MPNPNAEPIDSPLSRSTASTTTETQPYVAEVKHPDGLTILYSAARGGKLEPCGCRALNLGGIDREAAMVEAVRGATSATVYIDAGGFFREFPDTNLRLESWHLLDALSAGRIDAMNVAFPDLREGVDRLKQLAQLKKLPLISANIVDASSGQPVFAPYKKFDLTSSDGKPIWVAVVGVTAPNVNVSRPEGSQAVSAAAPPAAPETRSSLQAKWSIAPVSASAARPPMHAVNGTVQALLDQGGAAEPAANSGGHSPAMEFALTTSSLTGSPYTVQDEATAARTQAEALRPQVDVLILASYASFDRTRQIAEAVPLFDIAIAGDYIKLHDPQKVGPRPTLVVAADHDGKYLGQVDVKVESGAIADTAATLHPVLQSIAPLPQFTRFLDAYKADTVRLPIPQTQQSSEKLYAGASSCRTCHAEAFTQWRTHHHSRAMKALVDKQMHYNPDCLRCHTVAFRQPGGFTDLRVTPHLSNVQCEVCHGPGQKHVEHHRAAALMKEGAAEATPPANGEAPPPPMKMEWDAKFCMQCHDPQNDPHFNFDQDIQRVRHKNPLPPRDRLTTASLMM